MLYQVFMTIAAVLALASAVWQAIQTRRVRNGWKPKRFKGTHWGRNRVNVILGVALVVSGLLGTPHESRSWSQFFAGVAFLILGGVGLWCRRILDSSPTTRAGTS